MLGSGISSLVTRPRPERSGAGKILAGGDGEFLIIAHRAVDQDRIAGDVVEGVFGRDVTPAFADDQRQLAFIIEIVRYTGADHGAVVADQRVGEADEHARLLRQFAADLRRMGAVIDAGAEDFFRARDHRSEFHVGELAVGLGVFRSLAHGVHRAGGERGAQICVPDAVIQGDDTVAADRAEPFLPVGGKTQQLHGVTPGFATVAV